MGLIWAPMEILSVVEGVDNPRPEFLEAHEKNKLFIAHLVDEQTKTSVCGKAKFISGLIMQDSKSIGVYDLNDEKLPSNHWSKRSLICEKCMEKSNIN